MIRSGVRRSVRTFAAAGALALLLSVVPPARADDFVVTTQQDGAPGSLRDAIAQANAKGGAHTITFQTSAVQSAAGDTLSFSCAFAPFEGGPILIGEAQAGWEVYLEFPGDEVGGEAAAFPRTGADDAKSRFRLGPGDSYGLKRFVLDNRARTLQFTTSPLTASGSGIPPVGDDALTHRLSFSAIVLSPTTRAQSEAVVRIRRKKTTSGRWTQ